MQFSWDNSNWLRPVAIAGTTTAAIGFAAYCWRSYHSAVHKQSNIIIVRRSTTSSTSSTSSFDVDGPLPGTQRRDGTRIRTSERRSLTQLSGVQEASEPISEESESDWGEEARDQFSQLPSFGADPFEETASVGDDAVALGRDRNRSDSVHPNSAASRLPLAGGNPFGTVTRKRVLMLGLDGAGKSTLLRQLSNFESLSSRYIPTEGFRVIAMATQSCEFDMYEVGGGEHNRSYWLKFLDKVDLFMFVVDGCSTDERFDLASAQLTKVLSDSRMDGIPLLLVVTHQDRLQCLSPDEVAEVLNLSRYSASRHLCRPVGVSLHHGDPPEGIAKLRSWMFPVLARGMEIQDDADAEDDEEEEY